MRAEAQREYVEYVTGAMPSLRRLAYILCGDEHRADDLVQQAITKLYVSWPRIRDVEHLDQYVRTMVVRGFIDERRRFWFRVGLTAAPPDVVRAEEPAGGVEEAIVVRAALAKVPRRQQAVLVLRFLCDLPVDEVATMLDCSPGTVKSQTARGLATLRRHIEQTDLAGTRKGR
ncbi:SigE family RNA polymerase sigma factor [Dactylosporangium aurantiacum]|uniref:SigE family RNA polymerase sigma factor n=1 Tax=Dactylosporangium aurantiacum TaxID=35754 RepID=A0A9Q9IDS6_9ACTN|nr:SigE family RNA polymerase sigma factor [Dactylosporangium aurantiacum]MDG6108340.1 SigE family RNA polymerase sigma factor [Dactylosporangium aurantiacum]UWZ53881.1 SigE family RNA polymerase sigma factor [Dactylosporangium aurantiacum]